jgi:hypothetical protein
VAKKKTGIGIQALFEEVPQASASPEPEAGSPGSRVEDSPPEAVSSGFNLAPETLERLEGTCQFVSWLIEKTVSREVVAEAAIKIALENIEAEGKNSRLVQEILRNLDT